MKRALILLMALILLPWLFACEKGAPADISGDETASRETAVEDGAADAEEEVLREMDMTDKIESWRGAGGDGHVSLPGDWNAVVVESPADLAPYRGYFPALSDADAARITSDKDGIAVVLEVASTDTSLIYGVNEVMREEGRIVFSVSAEPEILEEEPVDENGEGIPSGSGGSPFEYFLFYIPAEHYDNESLYFSFIN